MQSKSKNSCLGIIHELNNKENTQLNFQQLIISPPFNPTQPSKPQWQSNLLLRPAVPGPLAEVVPFEVFNLDRMFAYTIHTLLISRQ